MANFRYFSDLPGGSTIRLENVYRNDRVMTIGGIIRPVGLIGWDGAAWLPVTRRVQYRSYPSKHECDARCMNASGRTMNCECSCGGKNHGKGSFSCD